METKKIEDLIKKITQAISIYTDNISINDLKEILNKSIHAIDIDKELKKFDITYGDLIYYLESRDIIGNIQNKYDINSLTFKYIPSKQNAGLFSKIADTFKRINDENVDDNCELHFVGDHDKDYHGFFGYKMVDGEKVNIFKHNNNNKIDDDISRLKIVTDHKYNFSKFNDTKNINEMVGETKYDVKYRFAPPESLKKYENLSKKLDKLNYGSQASDNIENKNKTVMEKLLLKKNSNTDSNLFLNSPVQDLSSDISFKSAVSKNKFEDPPNYNWFVKKPDSNDKKSLFDEQKSNINNPILKDNVRNRYDYELINDNNKFQWKNEGINEKHDNMIKNLSIPKESLIPNVATSSKKCSERYNEEKSSYFSEMYLYSWLDNQKNFNPPPDMENYDEIEYSSKKDENNSNLNTIIVKKIPLTTEDNEEIENIMNKLFNEKQYTVWSEIMEFKEL